MQEAHPKQNVEFYGVSCVANKDMCQKFKINSFPYLLTFAAGVTEGTQMSRGKANLKDLVTALELDGDDGEAEPSRKLGYSGDENIGDVNDGGSGSEDEDIDDVKASDEQDSVEDVDLEQDSVEDVDVDQESEEDVDMRDVFDSKDVDSGSQDNANQDSGSQDQSPNDSEDNAGYVGQDGGDHGIVDSSSSGSDSGDTRVDSSSGSGSDSGDTRGTDAAWMPQVKAGAIAARTSPREMDKYKSLLKEKRNKRNRGGIRRHKSETVPQNAPGAATTKMKAYTAGTPEFMERKKLIAEKLRSLDRREKRRGDDGSYKSTIASHARLPTKKAVPKPTFLEKVPVIKRVVKMSDEETLILDVTLSFIHGLQFGVFSARGALPAKKRRALKNWLDLLSVSLPAEWSLHDLIDDLLANIDTISESDANLSAVLRKYPTPRAVWSESCNKGMRGGQFSCGVWKLLHTVTVGIAEYRGGLNLIDSEVIKPNAHTFSPLEAADTIRDYIDNFFMCSECKEHFVANYDVCRNNRRCERLTDDTVGASSADWLELPAWLWEVHNGVSVRLLNERADKARKQMQRSSVNKGAGPGAATMEDAVRVLWPTLTECVTCFTDEGTWNQDAVFLYLEKTYWYVARITILSTACYASRVGYLTLRLLDPLQAWLRFGPYGYTFDETRERGSCGFRVYDAFSTIWHGSCLLYAAKPSFDRYAAKIKGNGAKRCRWDSKAVGLKPSL
jgi:hypothetical protein